MGLFLRYVKESKWVFLWILLFPALAFMGYWVWLDPDDQLMPGGGLENTEAETSSDNGGAENAETENVEWIYFLDLGIKAFKDHNGLKIFGAGMVFSFALNLILLLVVPCLGSAIEEEKKKEFFAGLIFNGVLALLVLPLLCAMKFAPYPDLATYGKLAALGAFSFLGPFLVGSRFVSEAYRNAFWIRTEIIKL